MDVIEEFEKSNGHNKLTESYDNAVEALKKVNERALSFIRERPAVALLGALALGFVVARLARHYER